MGKLPITLRAEPCCRVLLPKFDHCGIVQLLKCACVCEELSALTDEPQIMAVTYMAAPDTHQGVVIQRSLLLLVVCRSGCFCACYS